VSLAQYTHLLFRAQHFHAPLTATLVLSSRTALEDTCHPVLDLPSTHRDRLRLIITQAGQAEPLCEKCFYQSSEVLEKRRLLTKVLLALVSVLQDCARRNSSWLNLNRASIAVVHLKQSIYIERTVEVVPVVERDLQRTFRTQLHSKLSEQLHSSS